MFGRKAAEVAVEERCIMTRGNSYSSSSINIVFIGGWRDSSPSRFYPLSGRGMFWDSVAWDNSVTSRPAMSGNRITESLLYVKEGLTSKWHSCFSQPDVVGSQKNKWHKTCR